ncbi:DUF2946 domain-containing protein [Paraherbaspirillum soli]|uniref:DUF2946 domain-containing protein n=1 Tax=Paraherbaspirillum soli TaxID=631222 RepID=A0ABW0MFR5_9BURK
MTSSLRRFIKLNAWIAIFAILLNALAPSVTAGKAYASGKPMAIMGLGLIAHHMPSPDAAAPADTAPKKAAGTAETCPFCGVHAGSFGLPALPPVTLVSAAAIAFFSHAWIEVLQPAAHWPDYRSRAPPISLKLFQIPMS